MGVFEDLKARGLIAQLTNEENIKELMNSGGATFYIGYDATADSLHVGHYLQLATTARLQQAGNKPIVLLGGGTTLVGDPSGRDDMRKMITRETINHNADCFKEQMSRFIDFKKPGAIMADNADWLLDLNYVEFLREVGIHFSVNRMLSAECYKSRLETGLTFFELNYMIMQSYDFAVLHKKYGCNMQCGGDDQWSNILGGIDLIRRMYSAEVYGTTFSLLTTSDGRKMGKTQSGAVWLDANKTPSYDFFQYWRNVEDSDVMRCLKMLTFLPVEEIDEEFGKLEGKDLNRAKETLAFELTKTVHGEEEAKKALAAAKSVFEAAGVSDDMPTVEITDADFENDAVGVLDLLVKTEIAPSKSEARRLVEQGGIIIADVKIEDAKATIGKDIFKDGFVLVKKGKKSFYKVELK